MSGRRKISPSWEEVPKLRTPLTEGEHLLLSFLDQRLESRWEIYVQPHLNGLRPDFVLLHPERGICILEVKDWAIDGPSYEILPTGWVRVRSEDGRWKRVQNPMEKLFRYKCEVADLYCPSLDGRSRLRVISAGLVLPRVGREEVKRVGVLRSKIGLDQYAEQYPISCGDDLLEGNLSSVFPLESRPFPEMSEQVAQDLRHWLCEPVFSAEQRRPLELDEVQSRLVETRTETGFRRIKGPAGSGKSLVLAARAARLCDEGKEVVVVSFNITLLNYLRDLFVRACRSRDSLDRVVWMNFHDYCRRLAFQLGVWSEYTDLWKNGTPKDIVLNEQVPALVEAALTSEEAGDLQRIDAVLVDEGQDFRLLWWKVLCDLARRSSVGGKPEMVLAADTTQDIYETARAWTDSPMPGAGFAGGWSRLGPSYRMPPAFVPLVRAFATRFLKDDEQRLLPEPAQSVLDVYPFQASWRQVSSEEQAQACFDAIREALLRPEFADPLVMADLTVIVSATKLGHRMEELLKGRGIKVETTLPEEDASRFDDIKELWAENRRRKRFFFKGDARVKLTTIHSFKGWESRFMVVQVDESTSNSVLYAALTRLKRHVGGSLLTVVCCAPKFESYGATWA